MNKVISRESKVLNLDEFCFPPFRPFAEDKQLYNRGIRVTDSQSSKDESFFNLDLVCINPICQLPPPSFIVEREEREREREVLFPKKNSSIMIWKE